MKPTIKRFKAGDKPEYVRDNGTLRIFRVVEVRRIRDQVLYCLKDVEGLGVFYVNQTGLNNFTWGTLVNA